MTIIIIHEIFFGTIFTFFFCFVKLVQLLIFTPRHCSSSRKHYQLHHMKPTLVFSGHKSINQLAWFHDTNCSSTHNFNRWKVSFFFLSKWIFFPREKILYWIKRERERWPHHALLHQFSAGVENCTNYRSGIDNNRIMLIQNRYAVCVVIIFLWFQERTWPRFLL